MNSNIRLILPKNDAITTINQGEHIYFLAGPIKGGADWQAKAIKMLSEKDPGCYIACPCKYGPEHELFKYSLPQAKDSEKSFETQLLWERYYLLAASYFGSVIFYLKEEDKNNPRKKEDGPYARDTYGELGRWSMRSAERIGLIYHHLSREPRVNVIVGAERGFPGLSVIQKNFDADHGCSYKIFDSLEDTIDEAISVAKEIKIINYTPQQIQDIMFK